MASLEPPRPEGLLTLPLSPYLKEIILVQLSLLSLKYIATYFFFLTQLYRERKKYLLPGVAIAMEAKIGIQITGFFLIYR